MSFAGHAWDMMKRTQENRARLKEARESSKDTRKRYSNNKGGLEPDVTAEEYEEVSRQLKKRDTQEQNFYLLVICIFAIAAFGLLFLFIWLTR